MLHQRRGSPTRNTNLDFRWLSGAAPDSTLHFATFLVSDAWVEGGELRLPFAGFLYRPFSGYVGFSSLRIDNQTKLAFGRWFDIDDPFLALTADDVTTDGFVSEHLQNFTGVIRTKALVEEERSKIAVGQPERHASVVPKLFTPVLVQLDLRRYRRLTDYAFRREWLGFHMFTLQNDS